MRAMVVIALLLTGTGPAGSAEPGLVQVFEGDSIHFSPPHPDGHVSSGTRSLDNGREIARTVTFPSRDAGRRWRITGHLTTRPVPKNEQAVSDPWDRSANIRIRRDGEPDLEVIRHVTAYGGVTEHHVDLSDLAPVLTGTTDFRAFIDTWLTPAWTVDFSITFEPLADTVDANGVLPAERAPDAWALEIAPPAWVRPVVCHPWVTSDLVARDPAAIEWTGAPGDTTPLRSTVEIPAGARRVVLRYLSSGHCTDGRDDDEFRSKDNVIRVDGRVVHRFRPWRSDCLDFRTVNPYCRRWTDGTWSSDYSRSGFCPGDVVHPVLVDLTDALTPGTHTIDVAIEGIRPKADDGQLGYWRVSASLIGW